MPDISNSRQSNLWRHAIGDRATQLLPGTIVAIGLLLSARTDACAAEPRLQVATFRADLTPPVGEGACIGFVPIVATIEHPLELRGIILQKGEGAAREVYVIAALDYQGVCNSSDDLFRQRMAEAAGTIPERVALQSLHQHTAPVLDVDGARLLYASEPSRAQAHAEFAAAMADRGARSVKAALANLRPLTRVVASKAKVIKVASNRRIQSPDGSVSFRGSASRERAMQEAPEGLVDPWVRTLTFFDGEQHVVQVHYYATHPQSFYGDARVSWDVPGIAREKLERETGVFQIYFNGCGGNIGMGKYNDGSRTARDALSDRLYLALRSSALAADRKGGTPAHRESVDSVSVDQDVRLDAIPPDAIRWDVAPLTFMPRDDGEYAEVRSRELMRADQPFSTRLKAAMAAAWFDRLRAGHTVGLRRLQIGPIEILHLPGEPFVEFQLFAQKTASKSFVCVAGYGECGVWYFGPDSIFSDRGGYEQTWSFTTPCQGMVEAAIARSLSASSNPPRTP